MRLKLDENMPYDLDMALSLFDVDTVGSEGLTGACDEAVWDAAQKEGRVLVTQDLDFSDLRKFTPGTHAGILLLRISNPSRRRLKLRLDQILTSEDAASWSGCFVVATDSKLRVRRPK